MWKESEKSMSSTWRELRDIKLALASFKDSLVNKDVKWFTDNQSCVKIVQSGSMKHHLQSLAYNIFKMCVEQKNFNRHSVDTQTRKRESKFSE